MTELTVMDPTGRFTGMAEVYDRNRPNYPSTALDHLARHCTLGPAAVVVDVGCGTGISTRQFAQRGWQAIGVEPNADMRRQAEQLSAPAANPSYREGRAEATGLADGVADLVLAAQAFHWFEPIATLREFHRILKPAGWVALLWNERDEADPCTAAYGQVVRSTSDAARIETTRHRSGDALLECADFQKAERVWFSHEQTLDEAGLIGRALSVSYAPRQADVIESHKARLREVFARFQQGGAVVLRYRTLLVLGQRKAVG